MTIARWNDTFSLGHKMLDVQHRMLLALLMKLDIAFKNHMPRQTTMNICTEVRKFTDFHFQCEETLMHALGYPELERHSKIHGDLLAQLDSLLKDAQLGKESPSNLIYLLEQWIVGHLVNEDRRIADYLRQSGLRLIAEEEFGLYSK